MISPGSLFSFKKIGLAIRVFYGFIRILGFTLYYFYENYNWDFDGDYSIQKMKIMASGPITSWEIDEEGVEIVSDFIFGGLQSHCRW